MTTTVSYLNKGSTPSDVAINLLDQSLLERRSEAFDVKSGSYNAEYVLNTGDQTRNTTVSVLSRVNKDGSVFYSLKLRTIRTVTIDSVVAEEAPADFNISWSLGSAQDDAASVLNLLGAAYGLLFPGLTSKVPQVGIIGALSRGLVTQVY